MKSLIAFPVALIFLVMCGCEDHSPTREELALQAARARSQEQARQQEKARRARQGPIGARFLGVKKNMAALFVTLDSAPNALDPAVVRNATCFDVVTDPDSADGRLEIRTELLPPPDRESVSLLDCDTKYYGILRSARNEVLWRASRTTRVPIRNMPGYYQRNGISSDQARNYLLGDLSRVACQ
jgi:hypothetical protein